MWKSLSLIQLFVTPRTVAHQAPVSIELSRQEYRSGLHFLLQGIFLIQGSNPGLLHCRQILCHLSHQGSHGLVSSGKLLEIQNLRPHLIGIESNSRGRASHVWLNNKQFREFWLRFRFENHLFRKQEVVRLTSGKSWGPVSCCLPSSEALLPALEM